MGAKETNLADALEALKADVLALDTGDLEAAINTNGTANMGQGNTVLNAIKTLKATIVQATTDAHGVAANLN